MAFKEVVVEPLEDLPPFHKFSAVGDKVVGRFVSYVESNGKFGIENRYTFKGASGLFVIAANFDLHRRLVKAELKRGNAVMISYSGDLPPSKPGNSPMKMFKVMVDDSPPTVAAKPPPPPVADLDDDIPM
jgi:hypothetical protein